MSGTAQMMAEAIREFVRDRLGCGCLDDVFQRVRVDVNRSFSEQHPYHLRLAVGGRLLVYVVRAAELDRLDSGIAAMAQAGRAERDREGFNRFRAVLITDAPQALRPGAEALFLQHGAGDERAHLHVLDQPAVTALVRAFAGDEMD